MWEWTNKDVLAPTMLKWGAFTNGLTAFTLYDGVSRAGYIFAETERVRPILDTLLAEGKEASEYTKRKLPE